jgi:serine/threonine protein kinase
VATDNRVGEVLASKYRLEELLGSGGMGHVYRAVNEHVGRTVAIKVLRQEHAANEQLVERFLREARAANLVRHPNVVDVLDIGKEDNGAPFIVQELLEGEDLAHFAARRGGKLSVEEVVDLLGPVIDAVAEAHLRGVIHRDIKPENVFLAKGPRGPVPKLLDFGISKIRSSDLRATEVGIMMGTPAYMPPEQIQGARDADPRSDVWALGVMLFELLAGRMPFDAEDAPQLFLAIATRDAPTLLDVGAQVPPSISLVVARCLRRQPAERYPTAAELARDLRHAVDGSELEATGKRSIPPAVLAHIPDLQFPAAPFAPTITGEANARGRGDTARGVPVIVTPARGIEAQSASAPASHGSMRKLETPALDLPPLRPMIPRRAPAVAERQAPAEMELDRRPSAGGPAGRLALEASLSGIGLAPGPSASARAPASHAAWGVGDKAGAERADMSAVIGMGVVGLVAILGTGLLMQVAHRSEGWPLARFVVGNQPTVEAVLHFAFAILAVIAGGTSCYRGVRHWRGELAGGPPNAIVSAALAAGAFFSAIELVSAVT